MEKLTELSIVIPLLNEEERDIDELYARLTSTSLKSRHSYEIIFVDDGSKDNVFAILKQLHSKDKRVKVIRFTKNFGQAAALLAGFEYAKGEIVVSIDSDLQCFPEDIPKLVEKIDQGYDMVSGWRMRRADPIFTRKAPSFLMNKIMNARTGVRLHDWGCSFCAMKKGIVSQLKGYGKNARFIKPILAGLSKSITEVKVRHRPRQRGKSSYSIFQLISSALDFLTHYSFNKPEEKNEPLFAIKEAID